MVVVLVCLSRDWKRRTRLFVADGVPTSLEGSFCLRLNLKVQVAVIGHWRRWWWWPLSNLWCGGNLGKIATVQVGLKMLVLPSSLGALQWM
jgi:hypothetical protein